MSESKRWVGDEYERLENHNMTGMVCFNCHKTEFEVVQGKRGEYCTPLNRLKVEYNDGN